jgi:ethanolamine permease
MLIGIIALCTGKTDEIITISVFGALTLYIFSMVSLLMLRKSEPGLNRPFRVPLYPAAPVVALGIALFSFIAMTIYNFKLAVIYCGLLAGCYIVFKLFYKEKRSPIFS